MSVAVIVRLSDEEAAYLARIAQEGGAGLTIHDLATAILREVIADDRQTEEHAA